MVSWVFGIKVVSVLLVVSGISGLIVLWMSSVGVLICGVMLCKLILCS